MKTANNKRRFQIAPRLCGLVTAIAACTLVGFSGLTQASKANSYIVQAASREAPRENLRVSSSHIGMAVNPSVFLAVADRLVQDRDDWQRFNPRRYFTDGLGWLIPLLYPPAKATDEKPDLASLAEVST